MKSNAKDFLPTFLETRAKELGIDAMTLYPYDETMGQFGIPFTYGLREPEAVQGPMTEKGVAMRAFGLGKAYFAPNAPEDALMGSRTFVKREGIRSSASFPLQVEECRVGILFVNYRTPHDFDEREQLTLTSFANEVALALEKDSLLRESKAMRSLHEMAQDALATVDEETLLQTLVHKVKDTFDFDTVAIYWVDSDRKKMFRRSAAGLAEKWPIIGEGRRLDEKDILPYVIETRQPKIIVGWDELLDRKVYDACGNERLIRIFLPLVIDNKAEGVLEAGNERVRRRFISPGEQRALSYFVNQACLAIEKSRRAKESVILVEIGKALSSNVDLKTLLEDIIAEIRKVISYDNCVIFLVDSDGETVRPFHWWVQKNELNAALEKFVGKVGEGYTGKVIQTGEGMIEKIDKKPNIVIGTYRPQIANFMVIPLKVQNKVIGTINLDRWLNEPVQIPFQQHEFNFVSIIASQAAIAIENVRLLNQTQQHLRELELLKAQILMAIRRMQQTTNLDGILDTILEGVQAPGYKRVWLYQYSAEKHAFVGWKALGPNHPPNFKGYEVRLSDEHYTGNPYASETYAFPRARIYTLKEHGETSWGKLLNKSEDTTWVAVPLVVGGKVYGQVTADNEGENRGISERDLELLDILVAHAGLAIADAQAFDEMRRAQNNLQVITHGVSHSLKNPLFRMRLALDLIKREFHETYPDYYYHLNNIHKEIADGINMLLTFGRLEKNISRSVNVCQLVSGVFRRYSNTFVGKFEVNIPGDFTCIADPNQLALAFDLILQNATDAMRKDDKFVVSAYASANEVVIEFYNTGPPIPGELLPRLGKEVQSSKAGGSGIGLIIVNKIVELHGGHWSIENVPEGGVKVTLKLPREGIHEK